MIEIAVPTLWTVGIMSMGRSAGAWSAVGAQSGEKCCCCSLLAPYLPLLCRHLLVIDLGQELLRLVQTVHTDPGDWRLLIQECCHVMGKSGYWQL